MSAIDNRLSTLIAAVRRVEDARAAWSGSASDKLGIGPRHSESRADFERALDALRDTLVEV